MDTYFLENGVKISEQQKEARLICQLGTYIFWLILRKAWLQGLANDWKNICFHKHPDKCERGVKTILFHHWLYSVHHCHFWTQKSKQYLG